MTNVLIGRRYWKVGDHSHVWIVDAVEPAQPGRAAFVVLVGEDGQNVEDVDLSHLENPNLYTPVS